MLGQDEELTGIDAWMWGGTSTGDQLVVAQDEAARQQAAQIASQTPGFMANYATWTNQARPNLYRLEADLAMTGSRLYALPDTPDVLAARDEWAVTTRQLNQLWQQEGQWGYVWDTLAGWIQSTRDVLGLGVIPLLPIAVAAAVAGIVALAWVVSAWHDTNARAGTLRDLADRLSAGTLTPEGAQAIASGLASPSSSWWSQLQGYGWLIAAGVGLYFLAPLVRGRE